MKYDIYDRQEKKTVIDTDNTPIEATDPDEWWIDWADQLAFNMSGYGQNTRYVLRARS